MKSGILFISIIISQVFSLNQNNSFNDYFINVAKLGNPTVVSIISETVRENDMFHNFSIPKEFEGMFPKNKQKGQSLGSGVIIDKNNGYIITNNHVVYNAESIKVVLYDDREFDAEVVGMHETTDLAVLQIKATNLEEVILGDSDKLQVGEWVIAIGSPFGINLNHTVTAGIVSATGRSDVMSIRSFENFIQHDAAINPGNSGGALFNLDGEIVGINNAIITDGWSRTNAGVGFAIPINQVKRISKDLIKMGNVEGAWLGVVFQEITQNLASALDLEDTKGVMITQVLKNSPANIADLKEKDIIIKVDNQEIDNDRELMKAISSKHPGDFTNFTIIRGDERVRVSVTLGRRPDQETALKEENIKTEEYDVLGLKISESNDDGVKVIDLKEGSSSHRNGIKKGDIIKKISRKRINSVSDYNAQISKFNAGDVIMLRIERNGNQGIRAFTIE